MPGTCVIMGKRRLFKQLELNTGGGNVGLKGLLALGEVELVFDPAWRWVEKYLLFGASQNTIRSDTTEVRRSKRQEQEWWIQNCQDTTPTPGIGIPKWSVSRLGFLGSHLEGMGDQQWKGVAYPI